MWGLGHRFATGVSISILIVRRTVEIIGKEDKRFEISVKSAIGVKKRRNTIALKWPPTEAGGHFVAAVFAPKARFAGREVLVHAVHTAAVAAARRSSLGLRNLDNQCFGGEQQSRD